MCGGVRYTAKKETLKVYFPNPYAQLPLLTKAGETILMPWGRRKEQAGHLPLGGWARLDSINSGKWNSTDPIPVKIVVDAFMEKDRNKNSHWFDVKEGQFIQGLVAHFNGEQRVYVVTVEPDAGNRQIHERWPRIIDAHVITE